MAKEKQAQVPAYYKHLLDLHPLVQRYKGGPLVPSLSPYTAEEVVPVCVYTAASNGWQQKAVVPQYGRDLAWSRVKPALHMLDGSLQGLQKAWLYLKNLTPLELYRKGEGGAQLIDKKGGRAHANRVSESLQMHLKEVIDRKSGEAERRARKARKDWTNG